MSRLQIVGLCVALCVVAVGIGLAVARVFGGGGIVLGKATTLVATAPGRIEAATSAPPATRTAPPTAFPSPIPATAPPTAFPSPIPATATLAALPSPIRATATPAATVAPSPAPAATPLPPPPPTAVAEASYIEYTVQKGDILYTIAQRYNVTITDILAINDIPNPQSLSVGQVIRIPKQ